MDKNISERQSSVDALLYNAHIVNEGEEFTGYVAVAGPFISEVGHGDPSPELLREARRAEDLKGKTLIPGVIDDQVHFREPGLTHKADIASESLAALAGGVTSFMDMPNTVPPTVTAEALRNKHETAAATSMVNYSFFPGTTNSNIDFLRSLDPSAVPGVKVFLGSSTGNMLVDDEKALDGIFSLPLLVAVHSEDERIIADNRARIVERYGDDVPVRLHSVIRDNDACRVATLKAIRRARRLGTRLHILHVSTKEEAAMLDPLPLPEKRITAEVCVHHLLFTADDYGRLGSRIKCNPSVKTLADREALREALREGRIDIVATDHAPHLLSEKQGGALKAASGLPLVQFSLPAMAGLAEEGVFTLPQVVQYMSHRPALLFGIDRRGFIRPGYYADLTVISDEPLTVSPETILSKCGWSPFEGHTFPRGVFSVWVNGSEAFREGDVLPHMAMPLEFHHH